LPQAQQSRLASDPFICLPALEEQLDLLLDSGAPFTPVVMDGVIRLLDRGVLPSCSPDIVSLLRTLVQCWQDQEQPGNLTAFHPRGLNRKQNETLLRLLNAAKAVVDDGAPAWCRAEDIQALGPDILVRILGWRNLQRWVSPPLLQFAERRAEGQSPAALWALIHFLYSHRDRWYFGHLVLAAATLTGEQIDGADRNEPSSRLTCIKHLATCLQKSGLSAGYTSAQLDQALSDMLCGGQAAGQTSCLAEYVTDYGRCVDAQARWVTERPVELRALSSYLLPEATWIYTPEARRASRVAKRNQEKRRHRAVKAILPFIKPLGHQVLGRAVVLRAIGQAYLSTFRRIEDQDIHGEAVPFEVTLPDGSATLRFSLRQVRTLNPAQFPRSCRWSGIADCWLTEYLGAEDASGTSLPLPFFAVLHQAWYDPAVSAALATSMPSTDFQPSTSGLLRPAGILGECVTVMTTSAIQRGEPYRFLFDIPALCTGTSIGTLLLLLSINTGLRIHELQQFRLDWGYIGQSPADGERPDDFWVRYLPKGGKQARLDSRECLIDGMHQPLWREVLAWLGRTGGISGRAVLEYGALHGMEAGTYLFQFRGRGLSQVKLLKLVRAVCLGLTVVDAEGRPVHLTSHLLRHGNTRIRDELGHDSETIRQGLGHRSRKAPEHYRGPRSERGQSGMLGPIEALTLWQCLLPEIRSVQPVQIEGKVS